MGIHFFNRYDVSFTALDVGQGSCSVVCSDNHTVVIDCGGSYSAHAGTRAVNYLKSQQRGFVDALVLTHLHADHCNGAAELLRRVKIGTLYLPAVSDDDGKLEEILDAADDVGTEVMYIFEDEVLSAGNFTLTLFAPVLVGEENENCLIALASCGNFDILITGDSSSAAERVLCAHHALPDTEILVAGHHGSSTSTSQQLLDSITPDVAVISVGFNSYGHPHYSVLERLENNGIPYLRTDEEGNITLTPQE